MLFFIESLLLALIFITRLFFCDFSHSQISRTSYAQASKTYTQTQLFSRPRPWACSRRWSAESTMCIGAGIRSFAVLITAIVVFAARATAEPFELRILPLPAAVNESLVGMTYPLSSTRNIWSSLASLIDDVFVWSKTSFTKTRILASASGVQYITFLFLEISHILI